MRRTLALKVLPAAAAGLLVALLLPGLVSADVVDSAINSGGSVEETVGLTSVGVNTMWVIVAGMVVMFMQCGFMFLEIGFSRQKNAGTVVAKVLTNFSIAAVCWYFVGFAFAFGSSPESLGGLIGTTGFLLQGYGDPTTAFPVMGFSNVTVEGEVLLPVRLLRRLARDRLGLDARAHQVRRLHHLRRRLRLDHLPDRRALGLRRRLPAGAGRPVEGHRLRRHAGLRRLDRRPPHRRDRRARGPAAARPEEGQVRQGRQAAGDPRPQHAAVRPRGHDPVARLVRVQPGLGAGHPGRPLRRDRARHEPRRRVRRARRAADVARSCRRRWTSACAATARSARSSRSRRRRATSSCGRRSRSASSPA